jgi:hypothetical protein
MRLQSDAVLGFGAIGLAVAYAAAADRILESLLSDAVGARGVPRVLAVALAAVGVLLVLRTRLWTANAVGAANDRSASPTPHVKAFGLLLGLAVYVALVPHLGYPIAMTILIAGVAVYGGADFGWTTVVTAVAGAAILWIVFTAILGISMPLGFLGPLLA